MQPPPHTPHMSSARVASHMGAQQPLNHRVPWRGTQAGTPSYRVTHTHTHSHMATRSHMGAHRRTHTGSCSCRSHWFCHPVGLALLASWPACKLTVVLELGLSHTKSPPRLPALWASLAHRPPTHILPPEPGFREDAACRRLCPCCPPDRWAAPTGPRAYSLQLTELPSRP